MLVPSEKGSLETKTWNTKILNYDNDLMRGVHVHQGGDWAFVSTFSPDFRGLFAGMQLEAEDGTFYPTQDYAVGDINFDATPTPHSHVLAELSRMIVETAEQVAREAHDGVYERNNQLRRLSGVVNDPGTNPKTQAEAQAQIDQMLDTQF